MTKDELRKSLDFVNEERERLQRENDLYKSRIDKAIEYILNHELVKEKEHYVLNGNDLLNILRGKDK